MDPRIREHAQIVVDHSVGIEAGDEVVIDAHPVADDLVTALVEACAERGAHPLVIQERLGKRFLRSYLRNFEGAFETPEHVRALYEAMDAYIAIRGGANATETADVDPDRRSAYDRAMQPLLEERLGKQWCLTQYPSDSQAQLAGMSTEAYETFVWDAVQQDWAAVHERQEQLVDVLEAGDEVHLQVGEETDLRLSITDNPAQNDSGEHNLPGGEVFTAPIPDSVEGRVHFDKPLYHQGREVTDVRLEFEDGEVVEHSAGKNESVLTEVLETDPGARRIGELGIGTNRDIDRFTYNMLFDEKMGETVHLAVGRAYADCVAEANERNDSAVHVDMIADTSEDALIEVDGDVIQRDGTFWYEDGFEG
ncbi:aminopeptidase [Halococcoides cellulosivorans]|uniref:Aminopeptidase n=1 Tax=Halococcoides cellulosivorans TaxID=1679096 RepID=A0A2R4X1T6_9EURY|nr:aminopeptidase [Halococcoides cellulosivorans]AWB27757.1 aminopeptidase [Halococcoides cellulosivorans]